MYQLSKLTVMYDDEVIAICRWWSKEKIIDVINAESYVDPGHDIDEYFKHHKIEGWIERFKQGIYSDTQSVYWIRKKDKYEEVNREPFKKFWKNYTFHNRMHKLCQ